MIYEPTSEQTLIANRRRLAELNPSAFKFVDVVGQQPTLVSSETDTEASLVNLLIWTYLRSSQLLHLISALSSISSALPRPSPSPCYSSHQIRTLTQ